MKKTEWGTKSFEEQVTIALTNAVDTLNSVKVCDTPDLLLRIGMRQLPMLYTARHLRDAVKPKTDHKRHWHGIRLDIILNLPSLIKDPVYILDSASENDSIILITDALDDDDAPIIIAIRPNGTGQYLLEEVESNFIKSVYGKDNNFEGFILRAIQDSRVIYANKEKSQALIKNLGLQSSAPLNELDFDGIIHPSANIVNTRRSKNHENRYDEALQELVIAPNKKEKIEDGQMIYKTTHTAAEKEAAISDMDLDSFVGAFDFEAYKDEEGFGLIDTQGANLGDIEGDRFCDIAELVDRLDIYKRDYIYDDFCETYGYKGDEDYKAMYQFAMEHPEVTPYVTALCYYCAYPEKLKEAVREIQYIRIDENESVFVSEKKRGTYVEEFDPFLTLIYGAEGQRGIDFNVFSAICFDGAKIAEPLHESMRRYDRVLRSPRFSEIRTEIENLNEQGQRDDTVLERAVDLCAELAEKAELKRKRPRNRGER